MTPTATSSARTDQTPTTAAPKAPVLSGHDRCDASACGGSCGAQAFVRATKASVGTLQYCGHHAAVHLAALVGQGFDIHDERDRINLDPSVSANA